MCYQSYSTYLVHIYGVELSLAQFLFDCCDHTLRARELGTSDGPLPCNYLLFHHTNLEPYRLYKKEGHNNIHILYYKLSFLKTPGLSTKTDYDHFNVNYNTKP